MEDGNIVGVNVIRDDEENHRHPSEFDLDHSGGTIQDFISSLAVHDRDLVSNRESVINLLNGVVDQMFFHNSLRPGISNRFLDNQLTPSFTQIVRNTDMMAPDSDTTVTVQLDRSEEDLVNRVTSDIIRRNSIYGLNPVSGFVEKLSHEFAGEPVNSFTRERMRQSVIEMVDQGIHTENSIVRREKELKDMCTDGFNATGIFTGINVDVRNVEIMLSRRSTNRFLNHFFNDALYSTTSTRVEVYQIHSYGIPKYCEYESAIHTCVIVAKRNGMLDCLLEKTHIFTNLTLLGTLQLWGRTMKVYELDGIVNNPSVDSFDCVLMGLGRAQNDSGFPDLDQLLLTTSDGHEIDMRLDIRGLEDGKFD